LERGNEGLPRRGVIGGEGAGEFWLLFQGGNELMLRARKETKEELCGKVREKGEKKQEIAFRIAAGGKRKGEEKLGEPSQSWTRKEAGGGLGDTE